MAEQMGFGGDSLQESFNGAARLKGEAYNSKGYGL